MIQLNNSSNRSGCFRKFFFGCTALFLIFFVVVILIVISIELPDINFSKFDSEKSEYEIKTDSLTNEKIINSSFSWAFRDNSLQTKKYAVTFRLLEKDVKEALRFIDYLSKMSYKELGLEPDINFSDPILEARVVWAEVYRRVFNQSLEKMNSILQGFNKIFIAEKFSDKNKVSFIITFVQNIPYERPGGTLDLFPPLGTLSYRYGDCDSKAMLLYVILEKMNVDCAMLWSYKYKHAMLGVAATGSGAFLKTQGKKYYFLETTYPGWNVGEIPPEFKNTRFWFIDEIDEIDALNKSDLFEEELPKKDEENLKDRKAKPSPSRR